MDNNIQIEGDEVVIYKPERKLKSDFLREVREELKHFRKEKDLVTVEIQKRVEIIKQLTGKEE